MTRERTRIAIALVSLLAGGCVGWDPTWSEDVSEIPLAPKTGNAVNLSHTTRWSITYYVQVEVDRRIPIDDLKCILDAPAVIGRAKSTGCEQLDIALSIKSGNESIVVQPCMGVPITDRTVRRCIGAFKATSGKTYLVSAHVKNGVQALEATNPRLKIWAANSLIEPRT